MDWKAGLVGKKHILSYNTFIWFSDDFKFAFVAFCFIYMGHSVFVVESLVWENMKRSGSEILRDQN